MLKRHFKQFFILSVKSFCSLFNGVYYKQIDGVTMGTPLGPTLANLFLVYREHKWLESCSIHFRRKYYRWYIDDIFLMFEHKDHVKKFLRYMISSHRNIKFTREKGSNDKISFLNISITRSENESVTWFYWKETFSGVYMNYNNFSPTNHKKGLIDTLSFRSYNKCVDYSILYNEIKYLKTIWQKNLSPLLFIDSCVKKVLDKLFITRKSSNTISDKKEIFICLEFLGKISPQSKKQLIDIFRTFRKNVKLNVMFWSLNNISNAFRFKDQIPIYMDSNVIYKYKCNISNDVYIRETKRYLLLRQYEHFGRLILTEKPLKYYKKDATAFRKDCHQ